jgi:5S rRNA maturation endonuclease (ribonuclease M5)
MQAETSSVSVDVDRLKRHLSASDYRRIFEACGFDLQGKRGEQLDGVLGPKELGEGGTPNFSVNLDDGRVKDWGSSGYTGDALQVVQDVHRLDFGEALNWIVDELGLDRSRLTASSTTSNSAPAPSSSDSTPPAGDSDAREQVASHEKIEEWNERLMGDSPEAQAARGYLTNARGIDPKVLKAARIGLAHTPGDSRATWWVMVPVPDRRQEGSPIVAVKGFGFDPDRGDWKQKEGRKVARNAGSAALYDLTPPDPNEGPVLVCEGEIDALSALSNGFNPVTGTAGASTFRPEWASQIAALSSAQQHGVVVALDGDAKGRKAAPDVARSLHEEGLDVRVAYLPEGDDVNDVLMNRGRSALEILTEAARPFSSDDSNAGPSDAPSSSEPTRLEWEDLPLSSLPGPLESYVRAQAEAMQVDPSMIAVPGLCALAASVGNSRHIELKSNWREPPTLWSMLVAPSGTLKSPALEKALAPIFRKERQLKEDHDRAVEAWKGRDEEERGERPQRERRLVNDATVESVALLHDDHPRGLLLYRDELAGWLGSFNQYNKGESDLQKWIEFYESRPIEVDRKSSDRPSIFIEHPSVSVTGSIQPDVLDDRLNALHFQTGFVARSILVEPPERPRRWTDSDVTDDVRQGWYGLVNQLYSLSMPDRDGRGAGRGLPLRPGAKEVFSSFYNECQEIIEALESGPLRSLVAKNQAVAARLALTLQLAQNPSAEAVGKEAMWSGVALARWFRRETARVYQKHGFSERGISQDRRRARELPDEVFGIPKITQVWACSQATAYRVKDRLIEQGLLEKVGRGEYRTLITPGEADPYGQLA